MATKTVSTYHLGPKAFTIVDRPGSYWQSLVRNIIADNNGGLTEDEMLWAYMKLHAGQSSHNRRILYHEFHAQMKNLGLLASMVKDGLLEEHKHDEVVMYYTVSPTFNYDDVNKYDWPQHLKFAIHQISTITDNNNLFVDKDYVLYFFRLPVGFDGPKVKETEEWYAWAAENIETIFSTMLEHGWLMPVEDRQIANLIKDTTEKCTITTQH
jgi:hypothetical protein